MPPNRTTALGGMGSTSADIEVKAVMQRDDLAAHAWGDRLAFNLDGHILPDNEVADFEAEGFFLPGVHSAALSQMVT